MKIMRHEMAAARRGNHEDVRHRVTSEDQLWRIILVREAMDASGLCQKELAARIGIHKAHLSRWLHGVRPVPDRWLQPLADILEGAA